MDARELTTIIYMPIPTDAHRDAPATVTVTQTETVTSEPTTTPLPTRTVGRPWTTATPYVYTQMRYDYEQMRSVPSAVVAQYPNQPQPYCISYTPRCDNPAGKIAGSFFGGFGAGLLVCAVLMLIRRIRKRRRVRLLADETFGGPGSQVRDVEDTPASGGLGYLTPRRGSPVTAGKSEEEQLLSSRGFDVDDTTPRQGSPVGADAVEKSEEEQPFLLGRSEGYSGV